MSPTFLLNPAYLGAFALAGLPILIHLIRNRKVKVIPWAAWEFLLQARKKNRRRLRIEQLLLLAVRILMILLVVAALCRPILQTAGLPMIAADARVHAVIVIDNSFSMGYQEGAESDLDKAKRAADTILTRILKQGDSVQVVLASAHSQVLISQPTFDLNKARERVRGIALSDFGTNYATVIDATSALLQDVKSSVKEVYWITDTQKIGFDTVSQEKLRTSWEKLTAIGRTTWVNVSKTGRENTSIEAPRFSRDLITPQAPVRISSVVHNDSSSPLKALLINLVVDGRQAGSARIDVAAKTSKPVSFVYLFDKPGAHSGYLELTQPDMLEKDNRAVFAVQVREKLRVLIVDPLPSTDPAKDEAFYFVTALAPTGASEGGNAIVQPTIQGNSDLHNLNLKNFDAIVITGLSTLSDTDRRALVEFTSAGGGLLIYPSPFASPAKLNAISGADRLLSAKFGALKQFTEDSAISINPSTINHPALLPFKETNDINLGAGRFNRIFDLQVDPNDPAARVICRFSGGQPAMVERSLGLGKTILVASPVGASSSSLPFKPAFVPLVHQLVSYLAAGPTSRHNLDLGEKMAVRFDVADASKAVRVTDPEGKTSLNKSVLTSDGALYTSTGVERSGVYKVGIAGKENAAAFAVNRPSSESELTTMDEPSLRAAMGAGKFQYANGVDELIQRVMQARRGTEIWRPLIFLAILLFFIEGILAWKFGRRA